MTTVTGTSGNDTLTGISADDTITPGTGNDIGLADQTDYQSPPMPG